MISDWLQFLSTSGWLWMLMGALLPHFYRHAQRLAAATAGCALYVVDVYQSDESFGYILQWLVDRSRHSSAPVPRVVVHTEQHNTLQLANTLANDCTYRCLSERGRFTGEVCDDNSCDDAAKRALAYAPAPFMTHTVWQERMPIWFALQIDDQVNRLQTATARHASLNALGVGDDARRLRLTVLRLHASRFRALLDEIVARAHRNERQQRSLCVWLAEGAFWRKTMQRPSRPIDSVALAKGVLSDVKADIEHFFANQQRYRQLGVPFRRGYLLYGPPGNGKSSLVEALAGHYALQLCVLSLHNRSLDDAALGKLLLTLPSRAAVLIEDVDVAFTARNVANNEAEQCGTVTLSGLLNALDGVLAPTDGRLLFMTTNDRTKLDRALLRCGRVDRQIEIGVPDGGQIGTLVERFARYNCPPPATTAATQFGEQVVQAFANEPSATLSMALVQEYLLSRLCSNGDSDGRPIDPLSVKTLLSQCKRGAHHTDTVRSPKRVTR